MTGSGPAADLGPDRDEPVGTIAEEAFKLFRAVTGGSEESASGAGGSDGHTCSTTWCPICQVADVLRDHPEAVASVTQSAAALARSLRDLVDTALAPQEKQ
ncbi:hypothetical protein GEV29_14850 [Aeromicrobium sp. SMF47]|uniref:hypothetical protein n=1 Tax=Aeromicrobium yanjiei TaxID=2662028 RepID=UPI00129EAC1D|nr:hypothetical protein [Aeromicrobium yanjiei]MRJ77820.1 hypothetical protein [Aeromicrobium yanjiei]